MSAQREWKPGDVAMTAAGQVMRTEDKWVFYDGSTLPSDHVFHAGIRPLVVIDPEDADQVEHLTRALPASWGLVEDDDLLAESMAEVQAALREFANPTPPKPDEPKGLGAVVEDARGVRWVRAESAKGLRNPWQATLHPAEGDRVRSLPYADIAAVRVLSEGVTDAG